MVAASVIFLCANLSRAAATVEKQRPTPVDMLSKPVSAPCKNTRAKGVAGNTIFSIRHTVCFTEHLHCKREEAARAMSSRDHSEQ